MSTNSALVDLHMPAEPISTERRSEVIALIRRLVNRPRWPQARPYLAIGGSYRISDGRRRYQGRSNWVHAHH
jgi:hypothetical protein